MESIMQEKIENLLGEKNDKKKIQCNFKGM